MASVQADIAVIGAGVAGLSAAAALAPDARVVVLERESQPAYHTSGRSAAMYIEAYENPTVYGLTRGSLAYFENPPAGTDGSLLSPRGNVMFSSEETLPSFEQHLQTWSSLVPTLRRVDMAEALERAPVVRPEWQVAACCDDSVQGIDVHGLLQTFQRTLSAAGGEVLCDCEVVALERAEGCWRITVADRNGTRSEVQAGIVINASGAWGGHLGALAGAAPVPLEPRRRTAILVEPAANYGSSESPLLYVASGNFYAKPESGQVMVSPADETPCEPCDVRPEELDIAITVDRLQQVTTMDVRRVAHSWAGLRSFCPDRRHCVGFDAQAEGFFWLVGQGGCGVQTAPAMGQLVRGLIRGEGVPTALADLGVTAEQLSPQRFPDTARAGLNS